MSGSECEDKGINAAQYNVYPNWTQVDWKGDPDHANGGDRLNHNGAVWNANWWTQSEPKVGDGSWTRVCATK